MSTETIDLTDVDMFVEQRHHRAFGYLREHDPVFWNKLSDGGGFWALTRYDEVVAAYHDHRSFSSAGGAMLGGSYRSEVDTAANRMLVAADPPRHRMIRQQMHSVFGAQFVGRINARIDELVDRALDRAIADGGCDFATDIATELPAGALMEIVGVSHAQAHELIALTRRMIGFRDPFYVDVTDDERLRLAVIQAEIFEYFAELLREHGGTSGDDLLGVLTRAQVNGRPLTEEEILYNCMNVAVGGNETSSYSACGGILALTENPGEYRRLLSDLGLLDRAVGEILRWSSTNAYVQRVATRDIEISSKTIRCGDSVTLWNVSANRDESQFPDASRFDIARSPNRHVSFGSGIHRCVGATVANAELSILFGKIARRGIRFQMAGEVTRLRSNFIQGVTSLPMEAVAQSGRDSS
jgi:cytochrome P450